MELNNSRLSFYSLLSALFWCALTAVPVLTAQTTQGPPELVLHNGKILTVENA